VIVLAKINNNHFTLTICCFTATVHLSSSSLSQNSKFFTPQDQKWG